MDKRFLMGLSALALAGTASANMINEFEPNPSGTDPANVPIELLGTPSTSFSGWILTADTDFSPGNTIDRAAAVSGTYDANGLAVVTVPDLENPSFTIFFVDTFTGAVGDILDSSDDLATLGITTVYDAINTPDASSDEANSIVSALGVGTDLVYTGDEPKLIFREATTGEVISVNDTAADPDQVFGETGTEYFAADFTLDPEAPTFGGVNPSFIPEPASAALVGVGALAMLRRRSA